MTPPVNSRFVRPFTEWVSASESTGHCRVRGDERTLHSSPQEWPCSWTGASGTLVPGTPRGQKLTRDGGGRRSKLTSGAIATLTRYSKVAGGASLDSGNTNPANWPPGTPCRWSNHVGEMTHTLPWCRLVGQNCNGPRIKRVRHLHGRPERTSCENSGHTWIFFLMYSRTSGISCSSTKCPRSSNSK